AVIHTLEKSFIQAHEWERVLAVIREIPGRAPREASLRALALALVQAREWERAFSVVNEIGEDSKRLQVLEELAKALTAAGDYEGLLRLIQRCLMEANTRRYAVQLLPLAIPLISLKPEIGVAISESFSWADSLLSPNFEVREHAGF